VRVMAERAETVRLSLPQQDLDWAVAMGERMTGSLREAGYPIVGDLADLTPQPVPGRQPADVSDTELLDTALVTLAGLAEQYASTWWAERGPEREVDSHGLTRGASCRPRPARRPGARRLPRPPPHLTPQDVIANERSRPRSL